ncbi:hypothetical protein HPB51_021052 [Rhipicephalus microplus]|uniref:protein-tyrosine-phosphatase n=1 Tax=Rhipicephalus microplus TaxID=6941 RepID=A0A9J6EC20_RHIMP|nr:hypothetical protein HPB51_021052 [Rhipicephalus microplus]
MVARIITYALLDASGATPWNPRKKFARQSMEKQTCINSGRPHEARQKRVGVLVHCLAGVSRSVTVTLAYLMQKHKLPLNEAYDLVKKRKANIAPNFNFLGQLLDFEQLLDLRPQRCGCCHTPCRCRRALHFTSPTRTTPDSGIDLDRWT